MYKVFVGGTEDLNALCKHAAHWLQLEPGGKHIALGGDLDGCDALVDGLSGIESYSKLAEAMNKNGFSEPVIENIFWKNAIGVIEQCCM